MTGKIIRMLPIVVCLTLLIIIIIIKPAFAANPFTNPSFETGDLTGWSVTIGSPTVTNAYSGYCHGSGSWTCYNGGLATAGIQQSIDMTNVNLIHFDIADYSGSGTYNVYIDGILVMSEGSISHLNWDDVYVNVSSYTGIHTFKVTWSNPSDKRFMDDFVVTYKSISTTFTLSANTTTPNQYRYVTATFSSTGFDNSQINSLVYSGTNSGGSWQDIQFQKVGSAWQKSYDTGYTWYLSTQTEALAPSIYMNVAGQQKIYVIAYYANGTAINGTYTAMTGYINVNAGNSTPTPTPYPTASVPTITAIPFPTIVVPTAYPNPTLPPSPGGLNPIDYYNWIASLIQIVISIIQNIAAFLYNFMATMVGVLYNLGGWLGGNFNILFTIIMNYLTWILNSLSSVGAWIQSIYNYLESILGYFGNGLGNDWENQTITGSHGPAGAWYSGWDLLINGINDSVFSSYRSQVDMTLTPMNTSLNYLAYNQTSPIAYANNTVMGFSIMLSGAFKNWPSKVLLTINFVICCDIVKMFIRRLDE